MFFVCLFEIEIDYKMDNLDYLRFTGKSEADKAISTLKGLLVGVNIDGRINEREIDELSKWCESNHSLIHRNPFKELIEEVHSAISGTLPTSEVIQDLLWLTQKYEGENYYFNAITSEIQILHGICHGILADGKIEIDEINSLRNWLDENSHLETYYPYDELQSILLTVICDGKIDEEESRVLKAYFNEFSSIKSTETKEEISNELEGLRISALCTSNPNVIFDGKTFCITGIMQRGPRAQLQKCLIEYGCKVSETVTKETDYLIVGDNGNQAWAFACYGRKVEKALNMRKSGHQITIIHEYDFFDIIEDLGIWK
jgi:NAD-dependent DNA ligase